MVVKDEWFIRRCMAYGAYAAGLLLFPIGYMIDPGLKDIAAPYYTLITFVLTAYYTLVTVHDMSKKKEGQ